MREDLPEFAALDFDEALEARPQRRRSLGGRASAFAQRGQYDRAIADFTEVLRRRPRIDRALNERGLIHLRKNDLDAASGRLRCRPAHQSDKCTRTNNRALTLCPARQARRGHRRLRRGAERRPGLSAGLHQPGARLRGKGRVRVGAGRPQAGGRAQRAAPQASTRMRAPRPPASSGSTRLTQALAEGKARTEGGRAARRPRDRQQRLQRVPALRNPANDAKALAASLRQARLHRGARAARRRSGTLGKALKDFGDLAAGADWAVIYFAGHGVEVGGANYLIPVDAAPRAAGATSRTRPCRCRACSARSPAPARCSSSFSMPAATTRSCRRCGRRASRRARSAAGFASSSPRAACWSPTPRATAPRRSTARRRATAPTPRRWSSYLAEPGLEISLLFRKVRDEVLGKTARQQEPYTYGSLPAQPFYFKR